MGKAEICFKQLETKVNEKGGLDTQIKDLTAKVAEGEKGVKELTDAKTALDAKVAELTAQLEKANADLQAANTAPKAEEPKKEEPKKEEPKKEEPKKEEPTKAAA